MNRRSFLLSATTVLTSAAVLAACAGQSSTQIQDDVTAITTGLSGIISDLNALPANMQPPANILAQAQKAINDIQSNGAMIAGSLSPMPILQTIQTAIATLTTLLTPFFPVAPAIGAAVQAAASLIAIAIAAVQGNTSPTMQAQAVKARAVLSTGGH